LLKVDKNNEKSRKITNILKTAINTANFSKFQSRALLIGVLQEVINGIKFYRKNRSKLNAIFKVVKMNFGCKGGAKVSFHTAILLSRKFQENLGGQPVLPL